MPRRNAAISLLVLLSVAPLASAPSALAQPAAPPQVAPPDADGRADGAAARPPPSEAAKAEAAEHFEKGRVSFRNNAIDPALAEFLESRRLYPTRSATLNAALCLRLLSRFDEALAMFEALLREFPEMPADVKAAAQRQVIELRGLVGTIEIDGAEAGAAITVDGRSHGDYPLLQPLHVSAGSHVVRVYKEGFEPFETRVEVAGGKTAAVTARLRALRREETGRLRVVDLGGRVVDVIVDGVVVGKTPQWEGPMAVGNHTVILRGEGDLGAPPVSVPVRLGQVTPLSLMVEPLASALQIAPTPAGASVAIDAVPVGRGAWEGRLRAGAHQIEVTAEGFLPAVLQVTLARGEREVITPSLERDPSSVRWRRPSRPFLEVLGAPVFAPTFGSDVAEGCGQGCSVDRGLGVGGYGMVHGGYALGVGVSFGVAAGYLWAFERVAQARAPLSVVGSKEALRGNVSDALTLSGFLGGAVARISLGDRFPVHLGFGAGALIGSVIDSRTGVILRPDGKTEDERLGRRGVTRAANLIWVAPEVRLGARIGDHLELTAGVTALVLISPSPPVWQPDPAEDVFINAGRRGAVAFAPSAALLGRAMVLIAPGLSARYSF